MDDRYCAYWLRVVRPSGVIPSSFPQIIFSKQLQERYPNAQFVAPGHPLFDALLTLVRGTYGPSLTVGARFVASGQHGTNAPGLFWLLEATVTDGTGAVAGQKLVGVRQLLDGSLQELDPLALLDVNPLGANDQHSPPPTYSLLANNSKPVEAWCNDTIVGPYLEGLRAGGRWDGDDWIRMDCGQP